MNESTFTNLSWAEFFERFANTTDVNTDIYSFAETLIVALIFGLILKGLYVFYFRDNEPQDGSLARSLVLLTPALASIFWMIQSSVVLSLGLLGSMSFVRFRTPVKRSEDVAFIVFALAAAISSATHNISIGILLVVLFLLFIIVRNYLGEGFSNKGRFAILTYNAKPPVTASAVREVLSTLAISHDMVSSRTYDGIESMVFNMTRLKLEQHDRLLEKLAALDKSAHINVFYPNDRLGA